QLGLPEGSFNLGFMHLHGLSTDKDVTQARSWFEQAAAGDDVDALTHLGRMAMVGEGGAQDFAAARAYWAKGAQLGDGRCAFNLGVANAGGHGAPPDFVAAYAWFQKSDQLGNEAAQAELNKLRSVMSEIEVATGEKLCAGLFAS
ncbi:MAG: tetratricopeptide repeat protein, partial [Pseudomonadota bacterium]